MLKEKIMQKNLREKEARKMKKIGIWVVMAVIMGMVATSTAWAVLIDRRVNEFDPLGRRTQSVLRDGNGNLINTTHFDVNLLGIATHITNEVGATVSKSIITSGRITGNEDLVNDITTHFTIGGVIEWGELGTATKGTLATGIEDVFLVGAGSELHQGIDENTREINSKLGDILIALGLATLDNAPNVPRNRGARVRKGIAFVRDLGSDKILNAQDRELGSITDRDRVIAKTSTTEHGRALIYAPQVSTFNAIGDIASVVTYTDIHAQRSHDPAIRVIVRRVDGKIVLEIAGVNPRQDAHELTQEELLAGMQEATSEEKAMKLTGPALEGLDLESLVGKELILVGDWYEDDEGKKVEFYADKVFIL